MGKLLNTTILNDNGVERPVGNQTFFSNDLSISLISLINDNNFDNIDTKLKDHHNRAEMMGTTCNDSINLSTEKIKYRAEGNANLVLALTDRKQVLRIRKSKVQSKKCAGKVNSITNATIPTAAVVNDNVNVISSSRKSLSSTILLTTAAVAAAATTITKTDADDAEQMELTLCIEYIKVISKILGSEYTNQPNIVTLNISNYKLFNNWLHPLRPAERLEKEVNCRFGILYPDVAFLPDALILHDTNKQAASHTVNLDTFCVELKPKQGWTFYDCGNNLNFESIPRNQSVKCRFCCMQYLKLQNGSTQSISGYCPIDLFSGDPLRMDNAINELMKSPQNNFRIFKNGHLMYGNKTDFNGINSILQDIFHDDSNERNRINFKELLINILLNEFCKKIIVNRPTTHHGNGIFKKISNTLRCDEKNIENLPVKCVLRKILDVQLLAKSSMSAIEKSNQLQSGSEDKELLIDNESQPYAYIENLLSKTNCLVKNENNVNDKNFHSHHQQQQQPSIPSTNSNVVEQFSNIEKYLLGATALDCSMMLTFQNISGLNECRYADDDINEKHIIQINDKCKMLVNVTVMDLDPKAITHYTKYRRQTSASHQAYIKHLQLIKQQQ